MTSKTRRVAEAIMPVDDRFVRHTARTVQFATRVTPEWDHRIREIAERDGLLLVEVLEKALETYGIPAGSRKR